MLNRAEQLPDDEDDEPTTATGLNPDPDYEKLSGIIPFGFPEDDDDDLSSDDTEDDR